MISGRKTQACALALVPLLSLSCARSQRVSLRPFPYPYRAAVTLASDADEMDSTREFLTIMRYLAGVSPTPLGPGLGLEVGQSFWFFDTTGRCHFTYFQDLAGTPSPQAGVMEEFISAGYLDVIHSYGEFRDGGFNRSLAQLSLGALEQMRARSGVTVRVWSHHGDSLNTQNLGRLSREKGDNPGAPEYHADLLLKYGVKFLDQWDVTHIVGQDARRTPLDLFKEASTFLIWEKNHMRGVEEPAFVWGNTLLRPVTLDDGETMYAYRRFINAWGHGSVDVAGLATQLSQGHLRELVKKHGIMIVYTHLGGNSQPGVPDESEPAEMFVPEGAREALGELARESRAGDILVTTTSRLLTYDLSRHALSWTSKTGADGTSIELGLLDDAVEGLHRPRAEEMMGLTFYVPEAARTRVFVGGQEIAFIQRNPPDETGRESVTIPWRPLQFPPGFDDARWLAGGTPGPTRSASISPPVAAARTPSAAGPVG